jgi:hypothetical protein
MIVDVKIQAVSISPADEEVMKDRECEGSRPCHPILQVMRASRIVDVKIQAVSISPANEEGIKDRGCEDPGREA